MKVKVCGITQIEQLIKLDELGVDYAGMIFYENSARFVLNKMNSKLVKDANLNIKKVGVFVNSNEEQIKTMIEEYELDFIQLHGDETPLFCKQVNKHAPVIKAFRINEKNEQNIDWMVKPYNEFCTYFLFDTHSKSGYGGTGLKFNWNAIQNDKIEKEFFLSGGIGIEDTDQIQNFSHPFFYGIDLNSKLETSPGIKDLEKVKVMNNLKNNR